VSSVGELLAAGVAGMALLSGLAGGFWWLVKPRVVGQLQRLVEGVEQLQPAVEQLQPDRAGTTAHNAATAARALGQVAELRDQVAELLAHHEATNELRIPERLQLVELQLENTDRRLSGVEQAVIAQLGSELAEARRERRQRT
jgi:hypothetical protein